MDPMIGPRVGATDAPGSAARLRAFRATDTLAVELWLAVRALAKSEEGSALAREIRRASARTAGVLVAVSAERTNSPDGGAALRLVRSALLETRYYLYLARRLGLLDLRRYRQLTGQHDAALREIEAVLAQVDRRAEATGG